MLEAIPYLLFVLIALLFAKPAWDYERKRRLLSEEERQRLDAEDEADLQIW